MKQQLYICCTWMGNLYVLFEAICRKKVPTAYNFCLDYVNPSQDTTIRNEGLKIYISV